jgi:hypothetical protein
MVFMVIDNEDVQKEFCVSADSFEQAIDTCRTSINEHYGNNDNYEITEWGYSDPTDCDHCGKIVCHKLN